MFITLFQKIIKQRSEFGRNFITVFTGNSIAQAIPILISPVLTRIYSPAEIGVFSLFATIGHVMAALITGRYEEAIMLPKEREDAKGVFCLSIIISTVLTMAIFIVMIFFRHEIASMLNVESNSSVIFLLPIMSLTLAYFQIFNFWVNRNNDYKTLSGGRISQSVIMSLSQIFWSFYGSVSLVIGKIIGQTGGVIFYMLKSVHLNGLIKRFFRVKKSKIVQVAYEFKNYPLYSLPRSALNMSSMNLPIFLLGHYFNNQVLGLYSWSGRIIQTPMSLITLSLQQVFFQEAASLKHKGKSLFPLVSTTYKKLFLIGFPVYLIVGIFSPWIFSIIFGKEWEAAGVYTQYLMPWLFLMFLNAPISAIIGVLNKQKEYLKYEFILIVARFFGLFIGYFYWKSPSVSIALFSLAGVLYNLFLMSYLLKISKIKYE